jgi:DNA mismatch repair ATPase MutS
LTSRHQPAAGRGAAFRRRHALRLDVRELLRNIGDLERWTNRVMQGTRSRAT